MPAKNPRRESKKGNAKRDSTARVAFRLSLEPEILETIDKMFYWCDGKNGAFCLILWAVWMYLAEGRNPDEEMHALPDGYNSPLKKIVERRKEARQRRNGSSNPEKSNTKAAPMTRPAKSSLLLVPARPGEAPTN